jgi:phage terminase small subunit
MALNDNQRRFIDEYMVDRNATQAAIRAGYADGSAAVTGHRLLRNANIRAEIDRKLLEEADKRQLNVDEVLIELAALGRSSIGDYEIDDAGNVKLAANAPGRALRAVSSIKKTIKHLGNGRVEYKTEVRLWDKNAALEKLGKHLGLFKDRGQIEELLDALPDWLGRIVAEAIIRQQPAAAIGATPPSLGVEEGKPAGAEAADGSAPV